MTLPVVKSSAAYRLDVPERLSSWVARSGTPGSIGRIEGVRLTVCEAGRLSLCECIKVEGSAGVAVAEVDLQGRAWRAPGAVALPLGVGLDVGQVDEFGRGLLVGEVPAGLDRLADLAVQALDRVGGVDGAAQLLG